MGINVEGFDGADVTYEADRGEPPSAAVVNAMADALGKDPTDLPPLQRAIDSDALDDIFGATWGSHARRDGRVAFEYCGRTVVTAADGEIAVTGSEESESVR